MDANGPITRPNPYLHREKTSDKMCACVSLASTTCRVREKEGLDKRHFVSAAPRLKQILKAFNIWRLASLATLTADTFHATAVNSSSGVYITNSWRTCAWLAGGGRDVCLLCKGSSLPLLYFFLHFFLHHPPPTFSIHMAPPGAIIWQHPPPPHATTSCHMTNMNT